MKYTLECSLLASKSHYSKGMFEKDIRLRTCLHKKSFSIEIFIFFLQIFARLQQNISYTLLQTRKCMYTLSNICLSINIQIKIITLIMELKCFIECPFQSSKRIFYFFILRLNKIWYSAFLTMCSQCCRPEMERNRKSLNTLHRI